MSELDLYIHLLKKEIAERVWIEYEKLYGDPIHSKYTNGKALFYIKEV